MKDLYRAKFNYQGQVYEEFARASSTIEAFHLLLVRLKLTLGRVSGYDLKRYFDGRRANIELWRYSEDGKKQTNVTLEAFEGDSK